MSRLRRRPVQPSSKSTPGRLVSVLVAVWVMVDLFGAVAGAAANSSAVGDCPIHGRAICLDRADSGHRVHVQEGHALMVALSGATLKWTGLRQVGPALLHLKSAVSEAGALTASYTAVKTGQTVLRASGAPKCSPGKACPQFIVLWQVRVVVGRDP